MRALVAATALGLACLAAAAQDTAAPVASDDPAIATVQALLVAERVLLSDALERYRAMSQQPPETLARLTQLRSALDAELAKEGDAVVDRLEQLTQVAGQAGAEFTERLDSELQVVRQISGHVRRVAQLEAQLAALEGGRAATGEEVGALSGTWDIVLLPIEQKGTCVLEHSGARVVGTYRLQGGYSGSLEGTLINRKVYLVRIDSRMGKIMELEGYVSADRGTLSGTWLNYELAGAEGSTGHWSATRRAPAR